jgi:hypothetical protein
MERATADGGWLVLRRPLGIRRGEPSGISVMVWAMPLFFVASAFIAHRLPIALCLLQSVTGLPCPGCGITASVMALARGQVRESLNQNPAGVVVTLLYLTEVFNSIGCRFGITSHELAARVTRAGDRVLAVALLTQWGVRLLLPK